MPPEGYKEKPINIGGMEIQFNEYKVTIRDSEMLEIYAACKKAGFCTKDLSHEQARIIFAHLKDEGLV